MGARATPVEQFFQYSLLGLLASGYFALVGSGYLDLPTIVLTGAGLLWRLLLTARVVRYAPDSRLVAAATVAYIGFYPLDVLYVSREFIPATVHLICFLAVARALTARTNRDYFFLKVIAFLELLAATLLSSSINFFFFLMLFLAFGVATFCCSEMRRSAERAGRTINGTRRFHLRMAAHTAAISAGIIFLTAGLFFTLPRTARAAFRNLVSERYHLPGFSDEITLGQIGELKQQSTLVMHVRIEVPHEKASLKWRGAALTQFDGKRWYNPHGVVGRVLVSRGWTLLAHDDQRRREGPRINYQVRMQPIDSDALFLPGVPEFIAIDHPPVLFRKAGDSFTTGPGSWESRYYRGISHWPEAGPDADFPIPDLSTDARNEHLLLPPVGARVIELARRAGVGTTPLEKARTLERFLKTNYGYTTDLLGDRVNDPLDHFLFERRKGHCEYFASAMAVMLRVLHIPSRIATGFQGGQYNPMTGWHVVRASDAHSWVEAWIPGRGWTTFDPTPPDDTQRHGLAAVWARMMLYVDAAETMWRQWVIDYNIEQQIELIAGVERQSRRLNPSWFSGGLANTSESARKLFDSAKPYLPHAGVFLVVIIAAALLAPGLIRYVRARLHAARISRGEVAASDAAILYGRMLELLHRRGIEKPAWLTPGEFARIVPDRGAAPLVEQITAAYHDLRYGQDLQAAPRMVQLLQKLESAS